MNYEQLYAFFLDETQTAMYVSWGFLVLAILACIVTNIIRLKTGDKLNILDRMNIVFVLFLIIINALEYNVRQARTHNRVLKAFESCKTK